MPKVPDLRTLLQSDAAAKSYFDNLPAYVREQMMTRGSGVNSFDSLKSYAANLTKGDG